ncbi:hypothetical protein NUACC26_038050 [Scytonema sp. NUACC26]
MAKSMSNCTDLIENLKTRLPVLFQHKGNRFCLKKFKKPIVICRCPSAADSDGKLSTI